MSTTLRTGSVCAALVVGAAALIPHGHSLAALTNNVPLDWKSATLANDAYLENFEGVTPLWASIAGQTTQAVVLTGFSFPVRSNTWFTGLSTNVLILDGNVAVTNTFTNTSGYVSFATNALFVDMRIKFDALADGPTAELLQPSKLALYVNPDSNLVAAVYNSTWYTNSTRLNLTNWYQLTVKLTSNKFSVLTNDVPAFTNLTLYNGSTTNSFRQLCITGSGAIDELYVSHGNPAYPGLPGAVPPAALSGGLANAGGAVVTNWLANFFNDGRLSTAASFAGITGPQLDAAYLLNEALGGTDVAPTGVVYTFGITAIDPVTTTNVTVTAKLTIGSAPRSGMITGKVRLLSKATRDGGWTGTSATQTPNFDANGKAVMPFIVPEGNRFFEAQIVDPTL